MFKKLIFSGAILSYLLYTPLPKDWDPALYRAAFIITNFNRVLDGLAEIGTFFGYTRWEIVRPILEKSAPHKDIAELKFGQSVSLKGVTVTKQNWNEIPVFVFTPEGSTQSNRPGIVYYHGGGWTVLNTEIYGDLLLKVAKGTNSVVVSPNYRLAPENPFPAPYEDCLFVAKRFFERAEDYGVDSTKIVLSGDSAGGNMAAGITLELVNDYDAKYHPIYQFLLYPSTDFISFNHRSALYYADDPCLTTERGYKLKLAYMGYDRNFRILDALKNNGHLVIDGKFDEDSTKDLHHSLIPEKYRVDISNDVSLEESKKASAKLTDDEKHRIRSIMLDRRLSPIVASLDEMAKLPKTAVLTCQTDPLSDEGALYSAKLEKAGVDTTHVHLRNFPHGSMSYLSYRKSTWEGHEDETVLEQYIRLLNEGIASKLKSAL